MYKEEYFKAKNVLDLEIEDDNPQRVKFIDYHHQRREEIFGEPDYFTYENRFDDVHIISKKMRFIERLFKNGKLELEPSEKIGYKKVVCVETGRYETIEYYTDYESLIMLLAIQDNPITFILNRLK